MKEAPSPQLPDLGGGEVEAGVPQKGPRQEVICLKHVSLPAAPRKCSQWDKEGQQSGG